MTLPVSALPRGTALSRYIMALASTRSIVEARDYSQKWRDSPAVRLTFDNATSEQSLAADPLAEYGISQEFFLLFQAASLVGKLSAQMRPSPFRTKIPAEDSSGTECAWVAESGLKPAAALSLTNIELNEYKLALLVAISKELSRMSKPAAEQVIRRILVANVARFIDQEFLSSAAGVVGESPAGIGNAQQSQVSSGATAANIASDVSSMGSKLGSWSAPVWITRPRTFMYLAVLDLIAYAGGVAMFSGFPIYWSEGSPAQIMLIDLNAIAIADEGRSEISVAEHATITLDDGVSPSSALTVGLFQNNMIALRVERFISWLAGHDAAVVVMPVAY
jgi:HK97 family phage major capsid protein